MANVGSIGLPFTSNISSRDSFDYDNLPPELATEAQTLNRKQQMANYLIQQGLQPAQGQMVGGWYVPPSPIQGLAGLAQVAMGAYGTSRNDQARKDLSGKSNQMLMDAMQRYKAASGPVTTEGPRPTAQVMPQPQPGVGLAPQPTQQPVTTELPGPGAPVSTPRSPEDQRQAIVEHLMLNQHPQAQKIGQLLAQQQAVAQEHGLQREFLGEQKKLDRQNRVDTQQAGFGKDLMMASVLGMTQKQIQDMKDANAKAVAHIKEGGSDDKAPTLATIVDPKNPSRSIVIDTRHGDRIIGESPKLGDAEKSKQKTEATFRGLGDMLNTAEDLLTGVSRGPDGSAMGKRELPTGSKVGSLYDTASGWFGMSPGGAEEARQLKLVGAGLVSKVPRMEGPQSDKDVQLYKDMAADLGNDALPRGQRLSALKAMRDLYGKYEHLNREGQQAATPSDSPTPTKGMRKYNPATGKIE
jgi:hypothetical protein